MQVIRAAATAAAPTPDWDDNRPASPRIPAPRPATPAGMTRHALTALAAASPGKRRLIHQWAADYTAQLDGNAASRWAGTYYDPPTTSPAAYRWHVADAYEYRHGAAIARALGIATNRTDPQFPHTVRAVLAAIEAPVQRLTEQAQHTGQPHAVALLHLLGSRTGHCPITHGELAARARLDTLGVTL